MSFILSYAMDLTGKVIKNKKKAIHSLTDKLSEEEPDEELGSIQLINAMAKSKGLIHVEVGINGKNTRAIIKRSQRATTFSQ